MVSFPVGKIYNAYLIETTNYLSTKKDILNFAIQNGFERNLIFANTHPDIFFIESANESIKVNDIRDIIEKSYYSPSVADRKFYVIYDAVNLGNDNQNSLLKTLEEPPAFDSFFLVTSNAMKMLETIRSRCIYLRDEIKDDYKKIMTVAFLDDAVRILANLKYESDAEVMMFAERFDKNEDMFHELINIYRYILRDAITYKKTLSKELINVKEKEVEIVSMANTLSFDEIGQLIDNLDKLSMIKGLKIDKGTAIFNFLRGTNGKVYRN